MAPGPSSAPALRPESNTGVSEILGISDTDPFTAATGLRFDAAPVEVGARVELFRLAAGVPVPRGVAVGVAATDSLVLTDPDSGEGRFEYFVRQTDPAGNEVDSPTTTVIVDRSAPVVTRIRIAAEDRVFTGNNTTDAAATDRARPRFELELDDAPDGAFANGAIAELIAIDGAALPAPVIVGGSTAEGTGITTLTLRLPAEVAVGGHTATFRVRDLAGNVRPGRPFSFIRLADAPPEPPGSPVFTINFDLREALDVPADLNQGLFPWNISSDRTTQTIWMVLRGANIPARRGALDRDLGNHILPVDPAAGRARLRPGPGRRRRRAPLDLLRLREP